MEVAMNQYYKNVSVLRDKVDVEKKHLQQENDRLQHLVHCLIVQLGRIGDKFPLKEIDKQMELFDKKHKSLYKGP